MLIFETSFEQREYLVERIVHYLKEKAKLQKKNYIPFSNYDRDRLINTNTRTQLVQKINKIKKENNAIILGIK